MNLRKGIAALVMYAGIMLGGCSAPPELRNSDAAQLFINRDASYHYRIRKSRAEGERDLVAICKTARVEESWLFCPAEAMWYEIGEKEVAWSNQPHFYSYVPDGLLYHIHPAHALGEKYFTAKAHPAERMEATAILLSFAFPSPEDVNALPEIYAASIFGIMCSKRTKNEVKFPDWQPRRERLLKMLQAGMTETDAIRTLVNQLNEEVDGAVLGYRSPEEITD